MQLIHSYQIIKCKKASKVRKILLQILKYIRKYVKISKLNDDISHILLISNVCDLVILFFKKSAFPYKMGMKRAQLQVVCLLIVCVWRGII